MNRTDWLLEIINASLQAGNKILEVYDSEFTVEKKSDQSPLTEADKRAHLAIVQHLEKTNIPVLSEEGKEMDYSSRKDWKQFWMVDPLDGTKEFVKRNGEFTVNIALIENQQPTMGVIYVPVTKELYFADRGVGAFKKTSFTEPCLELTKLIDESDQLPIKQNRSNYIVVGSRSHMSEETENFINGLKPQYGKVEILSKGSSLKLCMVAEGKADAYPRFAPTMEWDTAAGQAIVECSGAKVINWNTKEPTLYNKENLLNEWFLVARN